MSVQQCQFELKHISDEITRREKKKSDYEQKVVDLQAKIIAKQQEIVRTTSDSSKKSKMTQMQGYQRDLLHYQKEAASEGKQLVSLYDRKMKAEKKLQTELTREHEKVQNEMQRTIEEMQDSLTVQMPKRSPNGIVCCVLPMLESFPDILALVIRTNEKYMQGDSDRNALDDMRLALEMLLQKIFDNEKSLENQKDVAGRILKGAGISPEYRNMINTLLDYYAKYQNNHVKHADDINPHEVDFIIEFTAIVMKQLITQFGNSDDE